MRVLLLTFIFLTILSARFEAVATQTCGAYHNLKHTKNSGHLVLHQGERYTVLREHKGQYLLLLRGAHPAQRWVDRNCFEKQRFQRLQPSQSSYDQIILALSWHPAFCETHRSKKECRTATLPLWKRASQTTAFSLHGLWPQPRNRSYCGTWARWREYDQRGRWSALPEPKLTQQTRQTLAALMPGVASHLHRHEWIKHGSCYGRDANHYFSDGIALTTQLNDSKIGDFFRKHVGQRVTRREIRRITDGIFGKGTGRKITLKCHKGLITELWLHLGSGTLDLATALGRGHSDSKGCREGVIDRAGFGR